MSLTVTNLDFAYPEAPNESILTIKRWSVNTGETVFMHGPSGSGKSTLLNVISGMLPVLNGEIALFNQRIDQMSARQRDKFRANHIGYVFQQFNLIPYLSVIDNIRLARHFSTKNTQTLKRPINMDQLLLTLNIDAQHWRKPAGSLSIGQQQRVAIARAFINQPKLLIVDEPTSSLDHKNRDDFMSFLLSRVAEHETTLIFVSHDMSLASYFSRIDSISDVNTVKGVQ